MREEWFARPVLFVTDVERTLDFYVNRLGFRPSWRHEENGKVLVAEAERQGCILIFSSQEPEKVGKARIFLSLNLQSTPERLDSETEAALDRLRSEFESRGVPVKNGWWGYKLLVVHDPDGNELCFAYPNKV